MFPDAKVVLTTRNPSNWQKSMKESLYLVGILNNQYFFPHSVLSHIATAPSGPGGGVCSQSTGDFTEDWMSSMMSWMGFGWMLLLEMKNRSHLKINWHNKSMSSEEEPSVCHIFDKLSFTGRQIF